jgi:hypothetical protein
LANNPPEGKLHIPIKRSAKVNSLTDQFIPRRAQKSLPGTFLSPKMVKIELFEVDHVRVLIKPSE